MLICKGLCRFETKKGGQHLYKDGFKRCTVCERGIKTNTSNCYCCGSKFRLVAQSNIYRQIRVEKSSVRIE